MYLIDFERFPVPYGTVRYHTRNCKDDTDTDTDTDIVTEVRTARRKS